MSTQRTYTIDVIAGDGIGQEVIPPAIRCVDALGARHGYSVVWRERDWGSDYYFTHRRMMPVDGIEQLADGDAILLGAVGHPDLPDHETLWGLLIPIRREFLQYINLRPVRILPGVVSPLRKVTDLDIVVVRENVEGEYSSVGGRVYRGRSEEFAIQEAVFTRTGIERVARFAADLAATRRGRLTSATKSNGIIHSMPLWDEVAADVVRDGAGLTVDSVLIDALAAKVVLDPGAFDVIVASNLFGDILSDLVAAVAGSIGIAPSANINPERRYPSMFEPVHGSAPDIAGRGIANPVGQLWSASLMLGHLGESAAADALMAAVEQTMASGVLTADLGGRADTSEFATQVLRRIDGG
ncbi:putative tartrate dehydrogenase [Nostocoides japonicum T1-X7]|uniref:D-malate dehydrogenase (decarboxylating) n=1 Tax=Nostocoides japonicum T1-X7 TaxID=1194083 RepID=A0A077M820_9MICO|nr:tartrate dehydrogenase [Tetrasphaera japonica]CCH80224.1 putative tartrate dehydrogenase [Tetrasphaera japonica T1-X7]